ncbi:peptidyl-prolyl cis-trans isomerase CYP38, chloroplastic isoform X2 [Cryptomeria japonica]|uniref:peptidyl-prolyl cis-trans isomerase CYP38, chloroplastic isoform X2 n=1 Tax=Cryptomeria japonica TaxID=3369 RepID=UPI0027D9EB95|nr:peptidyl-prolyl cis-trans isomerase CYP38, chloroplastic isoform X2 [Cryptomeria japonica]
MVSVASTMRHQSFTFRCSSISSNSQFIFSSSRAIATHKLSCRNLSLQKGFCHVKMKLLSRLIDIHCNSYIFRGGRHGIQVRCAQGSPGETQDKGHSFFKEFGKLALCLALVGTFMTQLCLEPIYAVQSGSAVPDVSLLMSGPPVKDPDALLRYALPIDNKPIRDIQKNLENIKENLKIPGMKALKSAGKNTEQATLVLNKYNTEILDDIAESKKEMGKELVDKLNLGLQDLKKIVEAKDRDAIALKQKELLDIVGCVEEDMVDNFPFDVPEEYADKPLLKGRAMVEMKVKIKDNPTSDDVVFQLVLDGYNAPVTAGNFVDLIQRHFYDGMEIQRADGFVVQTGDPKGPADGFVDPSTEKVRTIPLEIMAAGDRSPNYGATLEELGRYKARMKLPFNACGTMAMARDESQDNSASSQIFWLLKESEVTPSRSNNLDGRYSVFGYVTENRDHLADLKVGDVIESLRVVSGIDNLVNPSYKIVG